MIIIIIYKRENIIFDSINYLWIFFEGILEKAKIPLITKLTSIRPFCSFSQEEWSNKTFLSQQLYRKRTPIQKQKQLLSLSSLFSL